MDLVDLSPAPEDAGIARLASTYGCLIGGRTVEPATAMVTRNPATGRRLAEVGVADRALVRRAVAAARRAQPRWAALAAAERGRIVFRLARRVAEQARRLAVVESLDGGKPIRESRDFDVPAASAHLFSYAGWADKLEYAGLAATRPVGVVGAIIPWNFPLLMAAWKIAPALVCGNTVVLKPAETTPLTAALLGEIANEAGVPAGVLNIVFGGPDTGAALVGAGIDKLAFTGSTAVGRELARRRPDIDVTLELGGKGAAIVYDDVDPAAVAEHVVDAIFFNQGHVCCAGSRLLVAEPVAAEILDRLEDRMARIRVGDPLDKNTDLGAINSAAQLARIHELVESARADGAVVIDTGQSLSDRGYWYRPTLVWGVDQACRIVQEEVFGPVLAFETFRTPQEAVAKANNTRYGLAAGVFTNRPDRLAWTARQLRAGVVWANTYNRFDPTAAFGGMRESGWGREGGKLGLRPYRKAI